ncbi:hypothetical protein FJR06_09400 [Dolichospermum sp. UHCC 0352]|nr:hypothetical protein [Dolichospermum sp. UHCC 0352]
MTKLQQLCHFFWLFLIRNCAFFSDIFNLKRQFYGYLCGKCCYHQAIESDKTETIMSLLFCLSL